MATADDHGLGFQFYSILQEKKLTYAAQHCRGVQDVELLALHGGAPTGLCSKDSDRLQLFKNTPAGLMILAGMPLFVLHAC